MKPLKVLTLDALTFKSFEKVKNEIKQKNPFILNGKNLRSVEYFALEYEFFSYSLVQGVHPQLIDERTLLFDPVG